MVALSPRPRPGCPWRDEAAKDRAAGRLHVPYVEPIGDGMADPVEPAGVASRPCGSDSSLDGPDGRGPHIRGSPNVESERGESAQGYLEACGRRVCHVCRRKPGRARICPEPTHTAR